ncbi:MAG: biotin--[acetyl-CoA-carboxylase] ligase [Pseudomonadota bacterium]
MIASAPVLWFDEIDSTSEEAKRRAKAGDLSPVWIAARSQVKGKGRLGRPWISPPGNLYITALFPEPMGIETATRIPFAAALAVSDVCLGIIPNAAVRLKWPNDVRLNEAKLAGILTESGEAGGALWVSVGMGINVRFSPDGAGQAATSLIEAGAAEMLQPEHLVDDLRTALGARVEQARFGFDATRNAWLTRAEALGRTVEAGPTDARITGVFTGLAEDGGLEMRLPDGSAATIRAGDVDLVREV